MQHLVMLCLIVHTGLTVTICHLCLFVGLNHHRSTLVFGCGIISNERFEAYEWLLQTFLIVMAQKHPTSVITDGDLAMQKAIRTILANCNHRLCTWHIEQNILCNLHNSKVAEEFKYFYTIVVPYRRLRGNGMNYGKELNFM